MNIMQEKASQISELLKVLANENRLLILCALMEQPMYVGEILENLNGITQSALSQHLSVLKAHGILSSEKKGQKITYNINDHRVKAIINVLKQYYCE